MNKEGSYRGATRKLIEARAQYRLKASSLDNII